MRIEGPNTAATALTSRFVSSCPYAVLLLTSVLAFVVLSIFAHRREIHVMSGVDHPHILKLHNWTAEDTSWVYLILELCQGPDLQVVLDARGALLEHEAQRIFSQCANALCHLRTLHIIHRDGASL